MTIDLSSFSHGQIVSKLWLCETLEPLIPKSANIAILGSWYNVLAFMLLTRNNAEIKHITGIDSDPKTKPVADAFTNAWNFGIDAKVTNITEDCNESDVTVYDLITNCSPEHMNSDKWFHNLKSGTMVCIQSSDVTVSDDQVWKCVNPNPTLDHLLEKYPLSSVLYSGTKEIRYSETNGYNRFMLIGIV